VAIGWAGRSWFVEEEPTWNLRREQLLHHFSNLQPKVKIHLSIFSDYNQLKILVMACQSMAALS
jgi:hypothetical protein